MRFRTELTWQAAIALTMTACYFFWHPAILVDDAGFIIRYLRQSDAGCWYCFNASDGPLFGVSSFSHGAVTLLLYRAGLGSPEQCLWLANVAGTFATAWLLLRIVERLVPSRALAIPLAIATLFGAKSWMMIAATGMEVPIHTALVLAAFLALVNGRGPAMWFWLSMAVISKLDAVPIAIAFSVIHVWQRRSGDSRKGYHPFVEAAVCAGIPLACWIAFSIWYFGSPLPHSATAKLLLHRSTLDHWFPFGSRYIDGAWLRFELLLFLALWPVHVTLGWRRGRTILVDTAPGWAFAGLLVLYFVFNPAERMEWYYALPDLLLVLQVLLSLRYIGDLLTRGALRRAIPIGMIMFAGLCVFDSAVGVRWFSGYLRSLEGERYAIGQYVAANTKAGQILLAGHGLPGAWSPARVVDYSGLNSRLPLRYGGDWGAMAQALRPDAILVGGYDYYLTPLRGLPYQIEETFYEIAEHDAPPWHFIRAVAQPGAFSTAYLGKTDFAGVDRVIPSGSTFSPEGAQLAWVAQDRVGAPRAFRVGVRRPAASPADLQVEISWQGAVVERRTVPIPASETRPERSLHWHGVVITLNPQYSSRVGYRITFSFAQGMPVRFYAPILTNH